MVSAARAWNTGSVELASVPNSRRGFTVEDPKWKESPIWAHQPGAPSQPLLSIAPG